MEGTWTITEEDALEYLDTHADVKKQVEENDNRSEFLRNNHFVAKAKFDNKKQEGEYTITIGEGDHKETYKRIFKDGQAYTQQYNPETHQFENIDINKIGDAYKNGDMHAKNVLEAIDTGDVMLTGKWVDPATGQPKVFEEKTGDNPTNLQNGVAYNALGEAYDPNSHTMAESDPTLYQTWEADYDGAVGHRTGLREGSVTVRDNEGHRYKMEDGQLKVEKYTGGFEDYTGSDGDRIKKALAQAEKKAHQADPNNANDNGHMEGDLDNERPTIPKPRHGDRRRDRALATETASVPTPANDDKPAPDHADEKKVAVGQKHRTHPGRKHDPDNRQPAPHAAPKGPGAGP